MLGWHHRASANGSTAAASGTPETPLSAKALKMAWIMVLALMAWTLVWLAFNGQKTRQERIDAVPKTVVAITTPAPVTPPAPVPAPAVAPASPQTAADPTVDPVLNSGLKPEDYVAAPGEELNQTDLNGESQPVTVDNNLPAPAPAVETPSIPNAAPVEEVKATPATTIDMPTLAPAPNQPRIAIIIKNLGLNKDQTTKALETLPAAVTLSFSPYAKEMSVWQRKARESGHEFLLEVPMEPHTFPNTDPGPMALLSILSPKDNGTRLDWILNQAADYKGVITDMGSRFTALDVFMQPFMLEMQKRKLFIIDSRTTVKSLIPKMATDLNIPVAENDRFIDSNPSKLTVRARLEDLERIALKDGHAMGIANAYPLTLSELASWVGTLNQKGIALVPASTLVDVPKDPVQ